MSNNHKYPYEAQQKINDLERKLEASRQECERLREELGTLNKLLDDFDGSVRYLMTVAPQLKDILDRNHDRLKEQADE